MSLSGEQDCDCIKMAWDICVGVISLKVKRRSVSSLSMMLLSTSEDLALAAAAGFLEVPHSQYPKTNRKLTGKKACCFLQVLPFISRIQRKLKSIFQGQLDLGTVRSTIPMCAWPLIAHFSDIPGWSMNFKCNHLTAGLYMLWLRFAWEKPTPPFGFYCLFVCLYIYLLLSCNPFLQSRLQPLSVSPLTDPYPLSPLSLLQEDVPTLPPTPQQASPLTGSPSLSRVRCIFSPWSQTKQSSTVYVLGPHICWYMLPTVWEISKPGFI